MSTCVRLIPIMLRNQHKQSSYFCAVNRGSILKQRQDSSEEEASSENLRGVQLVSYVE